MPPPVPPLLTDPVSLSPPRHITRPLRGGGGGGVGWWVVGWWGSGVQSAEANRAHASPPPTHLNAVRCAYMAGGTTLMERVQRQKR